MKQPVLLKYQHSFCFTCIAKYLQGKTYEEAVCTVCNKNVTPGDIEMKKNNKIYMKLIAQTK